MNRLKVDLCRGNVATSAVVGDAREDGDFLGSTSEGRVSRDRIYVIIVQLCANTAPSGKQEILGCQEASAGHTHGFLKVVSGRDHYWQHVLSDTYDQAAISSNNSASSL